MYNKIEKKGIGIIIMEKIKLIMSDIDGTLLNGQHQTSQATINEIKRIRSKGIMFGLATGRPIESVKALIETNEITEYIDIILGMNGAHIQDFLSGRELLGQKIEPQYLKNIMNKFKTLDTNIMVFFNGEILACKDDEKVRQLSQGDSMPYRVVDFDKLFTESFAKILIMCDPKDEQIAQNYCDELTSEHCYGIQTDKAIFEFMHPSVSKSSGIKLLLNSYDLSMDNVLCFGDGNNDYEMLRDSGVGVAMGNATTKVKAVADFVTKSNVEDGLAKYLADNF